MFMPQRPYLPLGTLRAAITYPTEPTRFDDAAVGLVLQEVDLDHFRPSLDQEARWDKDLSLDEQRRLAFARMLLHAPQWVFLDDAMSALEEQHRQLMTSIFERKLPRTAVISMSRVSANGAFYSRTLHLLRHSGGAPLHLAPRPRQTPHSQRLASSLRSGIVDDYPGG
jgi:vitamin B12/bleomycin/antimicrobial peptide transport system ATP-binding/permease protein